jgi:hypothetical protein
MDIGNDPFFECRMSKAGILSILIDIKGRVGVVLASRSQAGALLGVTKTGATIFRGTR